MPVCFSTFQTGAISGTMASQVTDKDSTLRSSSELFYSRNILNKGQTILESFD